MGKISIVILNYNTKDLTLRAVQSCLDLQYKDSEVVVVDNASSDGSREKLQEIERRELRVNCVFLDENSGFAAGNNAALKGISSDYVMLLNSDAYFLKDTDLQLALDFMDQYPDIGVLSPQVLLRAGVIDPASHRGFPTPWNALTYFLGLEKTGLLRRIFGGYHQTWKDLGTIHDIDACTGAAMIVRREALEEVGLLDEAFFMYGEDLDWCFRFRELEWRIVFFPNLTVIHDKHSSGLKSAKNERGAGKRDSERTKLKTKEAFYDAMKLFYKKHNLGPSWMENFVLMGIHMLSRIKG